LTNRRRAFAKNVAAQSYNGRVRREGLMKPSFQPTPPSRLPESIHRQLNMYSLAASAAGVGALALTPTHHIIGEESSYVLALNHKTPDFVTTTVGPGLVSASSHSRSPPRSPVTPTKPSPTSLSAPARNTTQSRSPNPPHWAGWR
jgi:hypothetical protein